VVGDLGSAASESELRNWFDVAARVDAPRRRLASRTWADGLETAISLTRAECLLVAGTVHRQRMAESVRVARHHGIPLYVLWGTAAGAVPQSATIEPVGALSAVRVGRGGHGRGSKAAKRALDIAVSGTALVLLAPFLLVVAGAVLITSGRPVLFRQERTTTGGRRFILFKFRSMPNRTSVFEQAYEDAEARPFFKQHDTEQLTTLGGLLRRTSIDELPQLWNILVGDMSLVGPRPLPISQVLAHPERLGPRHDVPAGLTGWWQVNGRSDLSPEEACRMDGFYIENRSFPLDVYILLRTFRAVLTRRGAV
jgi:lipopolysaccharide/colanic/teichoic acid biosynthesis glycosyltransferase